MAGWTIYKKAIFGGIYFITETLPDHGTNLLVVEFVGPSWK